MTTTPVVLARASVKLYIYFKAQASLFCHYVYYEIIKNNI